MTHTFPHLPSRDAIMGIAKLKKSVVDIADEQIEAKKTSTKFVTVKIFFTIRPHLQPCHCAVLSLPMQVRVSEVQDIAWDILLTHREKLGPLLGPLPSEDPRDYMMCFFDAISCSNAAAEASQFAPNLGVEPKPSQRKQTVTSQLQAPIKSRYSRRALGSAGQGGVDSAAHPTTESAVTPLEEMAATGTGSNMAKSNFNINLSLEVPSDGDEDAEGEETAIGLRDLLGDTEKSGRKENIIMAGSLASKAPQQRGSGPPSPETATLSARQSIGFTGSPSAPFAVATTSEGADLSADDEDGDNDDDTLTGVLGERIREVQRFSDEQRRKQFTTLSVRQCEEVPPTAVVTRIVTSRQQQLEAFKQATPPQALRSNNAIGAGNARSPGAAMAPSISEKVALASSVNSLGGIATLGITPVGGAELVGLARPGGSRTPSRRPSATFSDRGGETPSSSRHHHPNNNTPSTRSAKVQEQQQHLIQTQNQEKQAQLEDTAARGIYDDGIPSLHLMLKPVFFLLEDTIGAETRTREVIASLFDRSIDGIFRFAAHCATIAVQATEKRLLDAAERQQLEKKEYAVRKKIARLEDSTWHENLTEFKSVFKQLEVGMIAQYRLINSLRARHMKVVEQAMRERANPYATME